MQKLIMFVGHTAGGKTNLAVNFAAKHNGEIISADSRQVYKGMSIGTGKDLNEYIVNNQAINYHIIDILNPGEKYNIFEFSKDFKTALNDISTRKKLPVVCGGSGLYIETIIKNYQLIEVPPNFDLRDKISNLELNQLESILKKYKTTHNNSDTTNKKRAIRAIEIADYYSNNPISETKENNFDPLVIGIAYTRENRRNNISIRLKDRLNEGLIDEAKILHANGLSFENMEYYGLEYKFLSYYLQNKINEKELYEQLNTAIHQFAKRQMTWFRRMEKHGTKIHWINGEDCFEEKLLQVEKIYDNYK